MRNLDVAQVQRFLPLASGHGVDAIVVDPNDTSRVATENICTCWGADKTELVLKALEYYRTHVILVQNRAQLA